MSEKDMRRRAVQVDARSTALTAGQLPADVWLDIDGPEMAGWQALLHPDDAAVHAANAAALLNGAHDIMAEEYRLRQPDGTWMWVSTTCIVAERDPDTGKPLRLMTVGQDITQRRNSELQSRHAHRLEAMGQLTGGVAHDFNNLLGTILGSTEALIDHLANGSEPHTLAANILDCTLNGAALTQRLLAFARRQPLQPAVIDLNDYLPAQVSMLRRTLGEAVTVDVTLEPNLWLIHADPSQVADVLLNLAINARDAMPHGGNLTIRSANATLDAGYCARNCDAIPGDYVSLSVSDTGVGMTSDVLARALEPFFTTKPLGMGSGLGLSTIYGFIRQSGGSLEIDSAPGEGTTVRIYLPRTKAEKTLADARRVVISPLPRGNEAILVVHDNDAVRATAAHNLAALGYRLQLAADGPSALAIMRAGARFDLLFTDVVMPNGLSGYQLAEAARALQPGLAVLLTTGFDSGDDGAIRVVNANILRKPYERRELAKRVRAALDGNSGPGAE